MIITEKKVLEIKDNVKCPQLGSVDYGKWGALRVEQRELINDLCDSWMYKDILLDNYIKNWNELKKWLEEWLNEIKQNDVYDRTSYEEGQIIALESSIAKVQELEQGKDE